jgi:TATA-binding protein-associated factor
MADGIRTDKLILLLDTGTSPAVRRTAAKQLADLSVKTFRVPPPDENKDELKPNIKPEEGDIKPDISPDTQDAYTLEGKVDENDAWAEVLDTISRLLPLLKSRSSETRQAASNALGLLGSSLPPFSGSTVEDDLLPSLPVDVQNVLSSGKTLLASAGREYIAKPVGGADKAKRRKAMMGSLGLGEVGWGDDVDQIIGDDEEDGDDKKKVKEDTVAAGIADPAPTPQDIFEGLSARQITMLKRKKGDIVAEANK